MQGAKGLSGVGDWDLCIRNIRSWRGKKSSIDERRDRLKKELLESEKFNNKFLKNILENGANNCMQ